MKTAQDALNQAANTFIPGGLMAHWYVADAIRGACALLGVPLADAESLLLTRIPSERVSNPKRPGSTIHPIDAWGDNADLDTVQRVLRGES